MANLLHCFHSVVMSLSSARFIPVTSWVSAHLSGGSLVRGSLVRGSLVRGFQGSLSGVHLTGFSCPGFTCPEVHLSVVSGVTCPEVYLSGDSLVRGSLVRT